MNFKLILILIVSVLFLSVTDGNRGRREVCGGRRRAMPVSVLNKKFHETCNTTSNVNPITGRTPDISGLSFTQIYNYGTNYNLGLNAVADELRPYANSFTSGVMYTLDPSSAMSSADQFVEIKNWASFSDNCITLLGLRCTNVNNMYAVRVSVLAGNLEIWKRVSGTWTNIYEINVTIPTGLKNNLVFAVKGSTLYFYIDGILVGSVVDTDLTTTGNAVLGAGGIVDLANDYVGTGTSNQRSKGVLVYEGTFSTDAAPMRLAVDRCAPASGYPVLGDGTGGTHAPEYPSSSYWERILNVNSGEIDANSSWGYLEVVSLGNSKGALYVIKKTGAAKFSADHSIQAYVDDADSGDDINLIAARVVDANNMYYVKYNAAVCELYKIVAGVRTSLGTSSTFVASTSFVCLQVSGTSIKFISNGVTLINVVDSSITGTGWAGVGMGAILAGDTDDMDSQNFSRIQIIENQY